MKLKLNTVDEVLTFTKIASRYEGDIFVKHNSYVVDGTSILGILSLNLSEPVKVEMIEKRDNEANDFFNELIGSGLNITKTEE